VGGDGLTNNMRIVHKYCIILTLDFVYLYLYTIIAFVIVVLYLVKKETGQFQSQDTHSLQWR